MVTLKSFPRRALLLTVLLVVTALVVGRELALGRALDSSYETIAETLTNRVPSILELSAIQRGLDQTETSAEQGGLERDPSPALDEVDSHLRAYVRLPASDEERLEQAYLQNALGHVRAAATVAGSSGAEAALLKAVREAQSRLQALTILNVREARLRAHEANLARLRAKRVSVVTLGAVTILILAMGILIERWVSRVESDARYLVEQLDRFSARLAQEIGGPLTPALLAIGTVGRDASLEAAPKRLLLRAEQGVRRTITLATGFLALERAWLGASEAREQASLSVVTRYLETRLRPAFVEARARLVFDVDPLLHVVMTDVSLAMVLGALARSSLDRLGDGPRRIVKVWARERGRSAIIEVRDHGATVPPELLAAIVGASGATLGAGSTPWSASETSDSRNAHVLALAHVREIAKVCGGSLEASSDPEAGTTFRLVLALAEPVALAVDERLARRDAA